MAAGDDNGEETHTPAVSSIVSTKPKQIVGGKKPLKHMIGSKKSGRKGELTTSGKKVRKKNSYFGRNLNA